MSTENVAIVDESLRHYLRGDYEAALSAFSEDVVLVTALERFHGHAGVVEEARRWDEAWEELRFDVEELLDAGDKVVLLYRQIGRARWSGVEVEERAGWVFTLREGKVVRLEMLPDRETALRATLPERH